MAPARADIEEPWEDLGATTILLAISVAAVSRLALVIDLMALGGLLRRLLTSKKETRPSTENRIT